MKEEQLQLALSNAVNFIENKGLKQEFLDFISKDTKADMEAFIETGGLTGEDKSRHLSTLVVSYRGVMSKIKKEKEKTKLRRENTMEDGKVLAKGHRITHILLHEIEYWYVDDYGGVMNESDIEHIEKCIKDGTHQGELETFDYKKEKSHRGWWGIAPCRYCKN